MKAAVLHAQGDIRYEEIETPKAGAGEVVIRVHASGICGSDVPRVNGTAAHYYPNVLGHEFCGEVAEVGAGVDGVVAGERVTAAPLVPCRKCIDCQRGDFSLCRHYKFIGSSRFGSFADYVLVPAENVVKLSDTVSFEQGAFFEPATVALHGLWCAGYNGGGHVAVLGGGTIGLLTMQWAQILGARSVSVFDINEDRLALATKLGADAVYNTLDSEFQAAAQAATDGHGFDYLFETAGQNATMGLSLELARNKARICFIGTSSRDLAFAHKQFELLNRKELLLTGSWMSYSAPFPGDEWSLTAQYMSDGRLRIDDALIHRRFALSQAAQAFAMFEIPGAVKGKLLLLNENSNSN